DAAQIRGVLAAQAAAWNRNDLDGYMATYSRAPELADDTTVVRGWRPVVDYYRTNYTREGGLGTLTFSSVSIVGAANGTTASISGRCKLTAGDGDGRNGDFAMQLQRLPEGWKVVRTTIPASHTDERETQSRGVRFLTGAAVLVLPRSAGEWLGIFHIRGGRGMMWFAELDTIVFDLVLLCALLALAARSSAPWRNPLTWLVLLITLVIGGLLAYSVSNFGTLFRLREMIYVGLFLVPLAVANQAERSASLRDPRTRHHPV
ncbi:MAG TPA: hypothetical protein VEO74_13680, partial [Thermoanaerobaculia bacterium]|nr:hypothetical protein [Thermoanaerobaculia bacterium]